MNKFFVPLLLVLAAGYVLWHFNSTPAQVGEQAEAQAAPQVKDVPKTEIVVPKVKVYAPKAKANLRLPDPLKNDRDIHVVESTRVSTDSHPHTITTLIDANTGETTTLDRREPLPWLTLKKTGAVGLSYDAINGIRTLYGRQDIVQAKAFYLSGMAALRSDRGMMVGLSIEYRW